MKYIFTLCNGLAVLIVVKLALLIFTGTVVENEHYSERSSQVVTQAVTEENAGTITGTTVVTDTTVQGGGSIYTQTKIYSGWFNALAPLLAALGASIATWFVFSSYQKNNTRIAKDDSE